jgi:hypothetical protein
MRMFQLHICAKLWLATWVTFVTRESANVQIPAAQFPTQEHDS